MKRKVLLVALALVCALTCAFGLVACDNSNNDNGGTGNNGSNGGDNKPSHTHTYSTTWTGNETHHWHICLKDNCDEVSDKAEHVWDSGEVTKEPTCTTAGAKIYTCTVCDKTKTEEIAATGHFFSEEWAKDETHHWHNCTAENCTVTDNSQKDGYAEHDFSNGDCVCGQAHPHIWSQTWEKNETHHWRTCIVTGCGAKDGYAEHDFTNGDCDVCDKKPATKELNYTLNDDDKSYTVTGISRYVAVTDIVIAAEYNGKPVTGIDNYAFEEKPPLKACIFPTV